MKRCIGRCGRELPLDAEHFHRQGSGFRGRCRDCVSADEADRRAGREIPSSPEPEEASHDVRLRRLRARVAMAPPGGKAEAADRARAMMAAADEAVRKVTAPPFDLDELAGALAQADLAEAR